MTTFEELGISPEIIRAIKELGFVQPMPVQEKVIPLMLGNNNDIVALAQTGTGKTAAFGVPLIQQIDLSKNQTQALILSPTRELCIQITGDLRDYSKYIQGLQVLAVYGGSSIENQIRAVRKGVHIIVATPGRLIDLMERRVFSLSTVSKLVLDEADEMLNMGFTESINTILAQVPENRSTLLFSATMPDAIARIAKNYMRNPQEITIGSKNAGAENVKHISYIVHAKDKYATLKRIADHNPDIYGIVFCRTRRETQEVADKLIKDGYNAESLHGDLSQSQRDYVMQKFRVRNIQLLVATDVAARGLDVDDLTHVINYTLPDDHEVYTHRSGRTGRAGKTGVSIIISNLNEKHDLKQIEKKIKKQFEQAQVPSGREICEKQLFSLIRKMENVDIDNQIDSYLPEIYKQLELLDKEEIIKRFVALEFNRFLEYYRKVKDLNTPNANDKSQKQFGGKNAEKWERNSSGSFTRMFVNMGKMDGFYPKVLIDLINTNIRDNRIQLGRIDLMRNFSFFEVDSDSVQTLISGLRGTMFNNREISIEIAQERKEGEEEPFQRKTFDKKPFEKSFGKPDFNKSKSPHKHGKYPPKRDFSKGKKKRY
jgi:ATP-dependent RNA helicase DeaD